MSRKILETLWSHNGGLCGFIITRDSITNEIKTYFGHADGEDEGADVAYILSMGQKIEEDTMKSIFEKYFNNKINEKE